MSDAFDALRGRPGRLEPDPAFRAQLMARLVEAVAHLDDHHLEQHEDDRHDVQHDGRPDEAPQEAAESPRQPSEPAVTTADDDPDLVVIPMDVAARARPRRRLLVAAAIAVAAALLAAVLVARRDEGGDRVLNEVTPTSAAQPTTTAPPAEPDLPPIEATEAAGATTIPTGAYPGSLGIEGGTAWVLHDSGTIDRYDVATGELQGTVPVTNGPLAGKPAFGFGSLWVATDDDRLWRVDLASGEILATVALPGDVRGTPYLNQASVAVSDDAVWVLTTSADGSTADLRRLDPQTNELVGAIPVSGEVTNIAFGFGSLWALGATGTVARIDPADGHEVARIRLDGPFPFVLALGLGSVWTIDVRGGVDLIVRIDPATNQITATYPTAPAADVFVRSGLAFAGGYLWTSSRDALLLKVDPADGRVVARYGEVNGGGAVDATADAVWFTAWAKKAVFRLPLG